MQLTPESIDVRFAIESDRSATLPANDAMGHKLTLAPHEPRDQQG
jgi:hypothetical protein